MGGGGGVTGGRQAASDLMVGAVWTLGRLGWIMVGPMQQYIRLGLVAGLLCGLFAASAAEPAAATNTPPVVKRSTTLTPEQRAERLKAIRAKREAELKDLRAKKAQGPLTAAEEHRLASLEKWAKERQATNSPAASGAPSK